MVECIIGNVKIHIEVPIALILFAGTLSDPVTLNLIVYRLCYLNLGYNQSECALLGTDYSDNITAQIEKEVQPHASVLKMTQSLLGTLIPSMLAFFLGPWSDKYGRRPVMLSSLTGFALSSFVPPIVSMFPNASPWLLLIGCAPVSLLGGFTALMTICFCYITDVTSEEYRGVRMGVLEAVISIGILLGTIASSYAFNALGYTLVFAISSFCNILALAFALVFIPESVSHNGEQPSIRSVFDFQLVVSMFRTTFKQRASYNRGVLLLVILSMVLFIFAVFGDTDVIFLYLREKFHWSLQKYTYFSAGHNLAWILGTLFGVYIFHKLLHINELTLMILGFFSTMSSVLLQGLAIEDWHLYVAAAVRCFGGVLTPMSKSLISKLVPIEEIGKIFSITTALESITGLISSPTYTFIYNSTLETEPGLFNFVSAGVYVFNIVLTIFVMVLKYIGTIRHYEQLEVGTPTPVI